MFLMCESVNTCGVTKHWSYLVENHGAVMEHGLFSLSRELWRCGPKCLGASRCVSVKIARCWCVKTPKKEFKEDRAWNKSQVEMAISKFRRPLASDS